MEESKAGDFYQQLQLDRMNSKVNSLTMSKEKYNDNIQKVGRLKKARKKDSNDIRFLRRYDVIEVNGIPKLIHPAPDQDDIKYYVFDEELFGILNDAHVSTGHGGRDRMVKHLKTKFENVTSKDILLFLSLCDVCTKKLQNKKGVKHLLASEITTRCQVDLIDFQSKPDGVFKFIMVYQDYLTKFVVLRPMKSNTAVEIGENLTDIFALFGTRCILQSENDPGFVNDIINSIWPKFKLVRGYQEYNQSQCSVIENLISTWMQEQKSTKWSYGLKFIQLEINSLSHPDIKGSPYEAMFGYPLRHGLKTLKIPSEVIANLETEEDLQCIINQNQEKEADETFVHNTVEHIAVDNVPDCETILKITDHCEITDNNATIKKKKRKGDFKCLDEQAKRVKDS